MKRAALVYGWTGHGCATSRIAEVSLPREPWAEDTPEPARTRPTETPMYARRATFGASGAQMPQWSR